MLQAITPQLLAAHAKAAAPAVRQALLQCLQRLEGAAPAAALYPVLVEMRRDQDGDISSSLLIMFRLLHSVSCKPM